MASYPRSEHRFFARKLVLLVIHCISFFMFISGVSVIYCSEGFKKGPRWMDAEVYENSRSFDRLFRKETEEVFHYVRYRDIFESAGEIDPDNPVLAYVDDRGEELIWTLNDVLDYAKEHGYSFDNDFRVVRSDNAPEGTGHTYPVTWRAYRETVKATEPGAAFMTLDEMTLEVMHCLGDYYRSATRFNTGNSNFYYLVEIEGRKPYSNRPALSEELARSLGKYVILKSDDPIPDNNLAETPSEIRALLMDEIGSVDAEYRVILAVDTSYPLRDSFYRGVLSYSKQRSAYSVSLVLMAIGGILMVLSLLLLLLYAGRPVPRSKEVVLRRFDRMMPEKNLVMTAVLCLLLIFLSGKTAVHLIHLLLPSEHWDFAEKMMTDVIIYLCAIPLLFSLVRAWKAGILWQNSFCRQLLLDAHSLAENITYSSRMAVYFLSFLACNLAGASRITVLLVSKTSLMSHLTGFLLSLLLFVIDFWFLQKLYRKRLQSDAIADAIKNLNLEAPGEDTLLDVSEFQGLEARLAHTINSINSSLQKALNDSVRSERMKAELITNVSHDIKTPLTSIINYIDLIKRAQPKDPNIQAYVRVLEQKSQHLKTLTEDLLEASKVSTGNIQINAADIDFSELVEQTNGEFKERFAERSLSLIPSLPSAPIEIHADGQHLWRVLENLYSNAFKYAARGSRVYADLARNGDQATLTLKNISERPLNISPEELTERFVRGDASRTTAGSGLGLSIAKSLTELQGGLFSIEIDGDYFKASVTFPVVHRDLNEKS